MNPNELCAPWELIKTCSSKRHSWHSWKSGYFGCGYVNLQTQVWLLSLALSHKAELWLAACPEICSLSAEFDLDVLRSRLDEDGMAIAERQEESFKQRRTLADATKGLSLARMSCSCLDADVREHIDRKTLWLLQSFDVQLWPGPSKILHHCCAPTKTRLTVSRTGLAYYVCIPFS